MESPTRSSPCVREPCLSDYFTQESVNKITNAVMYSVDRSISSDDTHAEILVTQDMKSALSADGVVFLRNLFDTESIVTPIRVSVDSVLNKTGAHIAPTLSGSAEITSLPQTQ